MIDPHIRFEGFDARSWTNLLSLFAPGVRDRLDVEPPASDSPDAEPVAQRAGSVIVVRAPDGRVLSAFHTLRGRLRDVSYDGPDDLPRIASEYGARRAFELREGVLEEVVERLAVRLERRDDYVTQWLVLARILREVTEAGKIRSWPRPFGDLPVPTAGMVRRALDLVLPDEHALVAVLWDDTTPWTAVVLRRRKGELDLVAGPDLIARWAGPLGGDWRRDLRVIVDAVSRTVAPVHLGLFADVNAMRHLLANPDPGAWARAAAVRDVVVHPLPPYAAVALGADAFRAATHATATLLGGFDALKPFAPLAHYLRGRIGEVTSITQTLGFDPLRALARSLAARDVREGDDARRPRDDEETEPA